MGFARKNRVRLSGTLAAILGCAASAQADVFEVADNGSVIVLAGRQLVDEDAHVPLAAVTFVREDLSTSAYAPALKAAADSSGLSPALLAALVAQESGWKPGARSARGAIGLTQLMPATAHQMGVNASNPTENLAGGARYLRTLYDRFDGDLEKSLAAYNSGPGRVARANGIPAITETRGYVAGISARLNAVALKGQHQ
jgi:soluble lytic murein transglycosylase-like protein